MIKEVFLHYVFENASNTSKSMGKESRHIMEMKTASQLQNITFLASLLLSLLIYLLLFFTAFVTAF